MVSLAARDGLFLRCAGFLIRLLAALTKSRRSCRLFPTGFCPGAGGKQKQRPVGVAALVICTRFELVTSCLSSKRSKPTELADQNAFPRKSGCKSTCFFETDKIKFTHQHHNNSPNTEYQRFITQTFYHQYIGCNPQNGSEKAKNNTIYGRQLPGKTLRRNSRL